MVKYLNSQTISIVVNPQHRLVLFRFEMLINHYDFLGREILPNEILFSYKKL
jgi:hypothetical protein